MFHYLWLIGLAEIFRGNGTNSSTQPPHHGQIVIAMTDTPDGTLGMSCIINLEELSDPNPSSNTLRALFGTTKDSLLFAKCNPCGPDGDALRISTKDEVVMQLHYTSGVVDGYAIVASSTQPYLFAVFLVKGDSVVCEVDTSQRCSEILDLTACGERWEGYVLNDQPCGWGEFYDDENQLVYRGFMYKDHRVCYGSIFYPDLGILEYEGMLCNGKKWGYGSLYDRTANLIQKGRWLDDAHVGTSLFIPLSASLSGLHTLLKSIVLNSGSSNLPKTLTLENYSQLQSLVFGPNSFPHTKQLVIRQMKSLHKITFYIHSFNFEYSYMECSCIKETSSLSIHDCPSLSTVVFGNNAFSEFHCLHVSKCDTLQSLVFRGHNFMESDSPQFESLPYLQTLYFGEASFQHCSSVSFANLPSLHTISLGVKAFRGSSSKRRTHIIEMTSICNRGHSL